MALATQCPHCGTQFRVAADQLKLRGGIVRCGACQQIFDGNQALVDLNAPPPSEPVVVVETPPVDDAAPVYTLELEHTLDPLGILPEATSDAVLDLPVDEELVAAALPDDEPAPVAPRMPAHDAPPMLLRESAGGSPPIISPDAPTPARAPARTRRPRPSAPRIEEAPTPRPPEVDEPEFVRRGREREESGKAMRIAMAAGSALLLLALVAQAVLGFRDVLAARYPALRPALSAACGLLDCRIGLPARPDQLVIETGELITLGGNAYTFSTQLRNQGEMAVAWPSIELTLNDADDKPLVRRVFGPRDYAPQQAVATTGFGARAEQPVRIHFRLEGTLPSGYHIAVFYP